VEGAPVLVAAAGPGVTLSVGARAVPAGRSAVAAPGETLAVSAVGAGVYGYLAVAGGLAMTPDMGSLSTHRRTGMGPAPLKAGDLVPLRAAEEHPGPLALTPPPGHDAGPIRVMAGPQEDWFDPGAMEILTGTAWTVDARTDRMGMFLSGGRIAPRAASMVSDGVMPGSIQVPPSGEPIVLMRDAQTTGGYPKIATVITADLDRLAQHAPGRPLRFRRVGREEAVAALAALRARIGAMRPLPALREPGTADLARANLIDGVWAP
ncbi:urea amidolyase, partial [Rhodobacterales bacterium HKCCE2091]|nr:urea amidolyase [Rhodobacterales bacterium HKCCE2091]